VEEISPSGKKRQLINNQLQETAKGSPAKSMAQAESVQQSTGRPMNPFMEQE